MKKVKGWFSCRPLGSYDFEFYVSDDASDEEINSKIEDMLELSKHYDVEEGYEEVVQTTYRKRR